MATAVRTDAALRPSDEIRQAQDIVRSVLLAEDLREGPQMLEAVNLRLQELEGELGELAGRQMMFEAVMRPA